jgi:tryptophan synthase alpha chain
MKTKTRIGQAFDRLQDEGKKGFVAYITAGDPSCKATEDMVVRLADQGVDVIELGIPFSDPLADGRVNQEAATRALAGGATFEGILNSVENIRRKTDVPILFFTYLNPIFAHGMKKALRQSAEAGVDGFLILDLPVEESADCREQLVKNNLDNICLVTPTSPDGRVKHIVKEASGFVYCVSRTGVTGMQEKTDKGARGVVMKTKKFTDLPVVLGFGISTPKQAAEAAGYADAVVVGSAIVKKFHEEKHNAAGRARAAAWVGDLVKAVKNS